MELGLSVMFAAFAITFVAIKVLHPFAFYVNLLDHPGGRKKHEGCIPLVGGLGIFAGVFLSIFLFYEQSLFIRMFMLASGLIVFMGMLDDRYGLSARFRLAGQFIVACIFVYGLDIKIESFGNLFGLGEITLGWAGYPLTILSIIGIINAVNMLDGMDGLVGGMSLISILGIVALMGTSESPQINALAMAFVGALSCFLLFNLQGKQAVTKVFLGDSGSMFVGLAIGVLLIVGAEPNGGQQIKPVTALWFVLLPMTDMFTLMYRRLKRGQSPLAPDRTHIHHVLMRAGFAPKYSLILMMAAQISLLMVGLTMEYLKTPEFISFVAAISFVFAYQYLMKHSWRFIRWNKRR